MNVDQAIAKCDEALEDGKAAKRELENLLGEINNDKPAKDVIFDDPTGHKKRGRNIQSKKGGDKKKK